MVQELGIKVCSVRDQVYDRMRNMIIDSVLASGARLDLNHIVSMFGVSKTPVNEAVQKLIQDGLLDAKPRSGTFVSVLNPEEIDMTFDFRMALESGAADTIVAHMTNEGLTGLRETHFRMEELLPSGDPERSQSFPGLDAEFHDRVVSAAGNSLLLEQYCQVNTLSTVARARGRFPAGTYEATLAEHKAIIADLAARDVDGFRLASRVHAKGAKQRIRVALLANRA